MTRRGACAVIGAGWLAAAGGLGLPDKGFAFYDKKLRWTCFPVLGEGAGWRWVVYEHDGGWLSPYAGAMNAPAEAAAAGKIGLRVENGWLEVWEKRGEKVRVMRRIMRAEGPEVAVLYPRDAHGDMAALWSWGGRVYYTNRDWKNIYEVPAGVLKGRVKPVRVEVPA
jgi:hypothetical protein